MSLSYKVIRPSVPPSGSHKCLRFGLWSTVDTVHYKVFYLLTYLYTGYINEAGTNALFETDIGLLYDACVCCVCVLHYRFVQGQSVLTTFCRQYAHITRLSATKSSRDFTNLLQWQSTESCPAVELFLLINSAARNIYVTLSIWLVVVLYISQSYWTEFLRSQKFFLIYTFSWIFTARSYAEGSYATVSLSVCLSVTFSHRYVGIFRK